MLSGMIAGMTADEEAPRRPTHSRWEHGLVLLAIVLLALNLRPAATSLGALLGPVRAGLDMSASVAGVLTTLPVLCFAVFGLLAPSAARMLGIHRVVLGATCLMITGLLWRAVTDSVPAFLLASAIALAGMAAGNVLLPPLVKLHFPDRVGVVTATYSMFLLAGSALPTFTAVPVAHAAGTWRWGLAMWGILAITALAPWLALVRRDARSVAVPHGAVTWRAVARTPMAWAMAGFFGLQSSMAYSQFGWLPAIYRADGLSPGLASAMLGLMILVGIPVPSLLPLLTARVPDQRPVVLAVGLLTVSGWTGLLLTDGTAPWLWAILLGLGGGAFPWLLAMIGLRTATSTGTTILSGFVQSLGYLIAAIGPLMSGVLFETTGSWTATLVMLALLGVPMTLLGMVFAKPRTLEEQLR